MKLEALKKITTKSELAKLLGVRPSTLTYSVYKLGTENQYTKFHVSKKSGGSRQIDAPHGQLKSIQASLSKLLLDCLDEINREMFPDSELANPKLYNSSIPKIKYSNAKAKQPSLSHGFERKRSIITNAMMHIDQKNVLNIDLKDFFGCFNFGRVRGFFIKNVHFQLDEEIATAIA
ncbi:MAG: ribonuclease H, partial [Pseudomonadales bacterium]|nr:ribonuclease H [Pseudomonadales bacterium]